jgi:NADH:ubiquinone oxidoreductase subunit C/NADH:ubiquinone oxidoreductase subunit 3 (subunit A)
MSQIFIYVVIAILVTFIITFVFGQINFNEPDYEKVSAYECGFDPFEDSRSPFDVRFYLIAIFFIIFDLEVIFLFPFVIITEFLDFFSYFFFLIFLFFLILGFVYEVAYSALDWNLYFFMIRFISKYISKVFQSQISSIFVYDNFLSINLRYSSLEFFYFIRDHFLIKFSYINDIWGVDFVDSQKRFNVRYYFTSLYSNCSVFISIPVSFSYPVVNSIIKIFNSANWLEREIWDLYGIVFIDHFDLRRILTDYGFEGHPFRKDFPLTGYTQLRYDDTKKRIISEPVELSQEYRFFEFNNPWENYYLQKLFFI